MTKVAEIDAQIAKLQEARAAAITEEREVIVAQVRKNIADYKITSTELKGLIKGRVTKKQIQEFLDKEKKKIAKAETATPAAKP